MENFILNSDFFNQSVIRLPNNILDNTLLEGSNQKKILIVSLLDKEHTSDDDVFLKKIMESVKIDLIQDTAFLSLPKDKAFSWKSITTGIAFDHLILFGNDLQVVGLQLAFKNYEPFEFQEKEIMVAEPLDQIANDRAKKGALWNALKSMFVK